MTPNASKLLRRGLLAAAFLALAAAPGSADRTPPGAACADCHGELTASFAGTPHDKAFRHDAEHATADCASCHEKAAQHAESGDPADVVQPAKVDADRANAACLTCHDRREHRLWAGSEHESAGVACVDCHAVHAAAPAERGVLRTGSDLCLSCHVDQRAAQNHRFRHPLAEDKMSCASCHQPHGAAGEKLIAADSVNDLCWSCHQEKRGPFLWEHSPVREECLTCHKPHGSNVEGMIAARPAQLCQSCHLQGRHQSVAGLDAAMWNTNRSCLNCHSQIHGSNHPSGPLFQR